MRGNQKLIHVLEINLAMVFISTSGALGRYVSLPVPVTIGVRAVLALFFLLVFCLWRKVLAGWYG